MSIKDKASDAAALALAGIIAMTPVTGNTTANSLPTADADKPVPTELVSINRSPMILPPGVELPADINPGQAATQPSQQAIRYLDVTQRQDGWGVAIATAVQASRNNKLVIISYLDPQNTRALYDAAVPFTQTPTNLPIVGLIRSPAAPSSVTDTPNPLGFDIFFNGAIRTRNVNPDLTHSRTDHLAAAITVIKERYFAATAASNEPPDTRVAVVTGGGGKSSSGTGSAGGSAGGTTDLASVTFNPDF